MSPGSRGKMFLPRCAKQNSATKYFATMLPTRLSAEIVGEYLSRGLWDKSSLSAHWDRNASLDPHGVAVTDGQRSLSWSDCKAWTDRFAVAMIRAGLRREDVLLVQLPNWVELPLIRVACEKAGVLSLPLARTLRQSELECCLDSTRARALVIPYVYRGFDYVAMAKELKKNSFNCAISSFSAENRVKGQFRWRKFAAIP